MYPLKDMSRGSPLRFLTMTFASLGNHCFSLGGALRSHNFVSANLRLRQKLQPELDSAYRLCVCSTQILKERLFVFFKQLGLMDRTFSSATDLPKAGHRSSTMNSNANSSNHRLLSCLGESTSNMLSFQDMTPENCPIAVAERPMDRVRLQRKPFKQESTTYHHAYQPFPQSNKLPLQGKPSLDTSHRKKVSNSLNPREICLPSLDRVAVRSSGRSRIADPVDPETPRHRIEPQQWSRSIVNVMPGHSVPMVGIQETLHAMDRNHCTDSACMQCETFLYCIDSATMVLCPLCRCISPVGSGGTTAPSLGVGLTLEHILEDPTAKRVDKY